MKQGSKIEKLNFSKTIILYYKQWMDRSYKVYVFHLRLALPVEYK